MACVFWHLATLHAQVTFSLRTTQRVAVPDNEDEEQFFDTVEEQPADQNKASKVRVNESEYK
jgi:hypothetical protein